MAVARSSGQERVPPHPDVQAITLQKVLEALVDPVRRSIVCQLYAASGDINCGAFDLPVEKSTATHHFRVLREAGLIRQYYVGTSRMNALRHVEIDTVFPGLLGVLVTAGDGSRPAGPGPATPGPDTQTGL
ncbi:helix-turn-helix transcriptional regulator [Frankia sp. Cr1]|uniref:ArsR/SmtB family transcription factor n=1 Tax=Frankia sp. Cr1 TaxID=3073931 RepID=UPI002AD1EEB1|nr:helix-turn-helix transcriptional regulator [Frankia sp. Cr1]